MTRRAASKGGAPVANFDRVRFKIVWLNPITNRLFQIRITHTRDYLSSGQDHIEIECIKPAKAKLPMTETGYRSHFMNGRELADAGGPVRFVTAWFARAQKDKAWIAATIKEAQGDLFQWADAGRTATARMSKATQSRATVSKSSTQQVTPDPDYVADREVSDSQRRKRMVAQQRGKKVLPPREP